MGQQEVVNVLKKAKGKPLSMQEIAKQLNLECWKVAKILGKMIKNKSVDYKELDYIQARHRFKNNNYKRCVRIFFLID